MSEISLQPVRTKRTFEVVIGRILEAIDASGLGVGDRLPTEAKMAEMLEISRPTVRQALTVLSASGVIRSKAGSSGGVFVATNMIPLDILGRRIAQELDQIAELMQMRRLLEPIVVHLALDEATESELDRVQETIDLMRENIGNPQLVQQADGMYHRRLAHSARRPIVVNAILELYKQLISLRDAINITEEVAIQMIRLHTNQLNAIRDRDHNKLDAALADSFVSLETEFEIKPRCGVQWLDFTKSVDKPMAS